MKGTILITLLAAGLLCAGCATPPPDVSRDIQAIQKQLADNSQKLDASRDTIMKELEAMKKAVADLSELAQNQQKTNQRLESQMEIIQKSLASPKGGPGAQGNLGPLVDAGMNLMTDFRNRQADQLTETLKLDDDQKAKVKAAMEAGHEALRKTMTELRETGKVDPDKWRKAIEDSRSQTDEELKKILTPEQMTEYKKTQEKWRDRGRSGWGRHQEGRNESATDQSARPGEKSAAPDANTGNAEHK